jgi:hypothetical protein
VGIDNNLNIANMVTGASSQAVDESGVSRGFGA